MAGPLVPALAVSPGELDHLLSRLLTLAAGWSGFRSDAIHPEAIRRAALPLLEAGITPTELLARASAGDRGIVQTFCDSISVGETYFFRHPEHFELVARRLLAATPAEYPHGLRAWCAGCATGEEAYSVAALLQAQVAPRGIGVSVVGTDLSTRSLTAAQFGVYRPWSVRDSGPLLYPAVKARGDGMLEVLPDVRRVTSFRAHNLLEGPLPGPFDLIFCRNVLIYFGLPTLTAAVERLVSVLAPGGILVLGTMDIVTPPQDLLRLGPHGVNVFARAHITPPARPANVVPVRSPRTATPLSVRRIRTTPPANQLPSAPANLDPIGVHVRALVLIEQGSCDEAAALLTELRQNAPAYLPGLFERALLHQRVGEFAAAKVLVRELLRRSDGLPPDGDVAGPELLPLSYYRTSALTMLESKARGRR
jgi:chemotaxis protein methyltransferase CheR